MHPGLVDGESLETATLTARRGDVLGAGGTPLVTERDVVRFGIDKTEVPGSAVAVRSAKRLARVVDVDPTPYAESVRAAGDQAFVEAITLRSQDARKIPDADLDFPGASAIGTTRSLAPTAEFAAPILGRVGDATAEMIADSDGELAVGDVVGVSGLEARYEDRLAGTDGVEVRAVSVDGNVRPLFDVEPADGTPLATSLSLPMQRRAERVLGSVPDDTASALVALRPSTGDVLAAASGAGSGGLNTATFGQFAPGSTFKIVSALALLRSGLSPTSKVACPASTVVDGKRFTNYDDYPSDGLGRITLTTALANSCNTAFVGQRDRIDDGVLPDAAAALGLGVDRDLGYPVYLGQVPGPASETEAAADLIGQGRVLAAPVTMAAVIGSAQAGRAVLPRLVLDGEAPEADPADPLTPQEARALRTMLGAVVERGSGRLLAPYGVDGAKTGTAEYGAPGAGGDLATHAWMVATRGDLAVCAFVGTGDSGSGTAGPLLVDFLR